MEAPRLLLHVDVHGEAEDEDGGEDEDDGEAHGDVAGAEGGPAGLEVEGVGGLDLRHPLQQPLVTPDPEAVQEEGHDVDDGL